MKKKNLPISAVLLLMLVTACAVFILTYMMTYVSFSNKLKKYGALNEIDTLVELYYLGDVDRETINDWLAYGYMEGLGDKYGYYMNKQEFTEYVSSMEGDGAGLGIRITYDSELRTLDIFRVIPGTPAEKAGFLAGDRVYSVDGKVISELEYTEILDALKGDTGTKHTVVVLRGENYSDSVTIDVQTAIYDIETVEYHVFEGESAKKTGVIRIYEFANKTAKEFKTAIEALKADGVEQLVFDLRNNPGGALSSVVDMLDYLLPEGPIVRMLNKNGQVIKTYTSDEENKCDLPMAILTNGSSASASELFTSALKDYGKVFTVGTETFGKGTVLTVFPLSNGGALVISTQMYCPPFSDNFEGDGIDPDFEVILPDQTNIYKLNDISDPQLIRAVEELNKK